MIRGFFRLVGLLLLAGAFIFMVYDGARFVADQTLRFTRFGQFWNDVHQASQQAFRSWVEGVAPWLWTLAIVAPLIIVSILSSITSLGTTAQLRTIGARSVGWLLTLNALAVLLTLQIVMFAY